MTTIAADTQRHKDQIEALANGWHDNPFGFLGLHASGKARVVRVFVPTARRVSLVGARGQLLTECERVHHTGLFIGVMPPRKRRYVLHIVHHDGREETREDAYRFAPRLGALDLHLLGEGNDRRIYEKLGAHCCTLDRVPGVCFAVWAPNASRVSVVGDFNGWDGRCHVMRRYVGTGYWELFVPQLGAGSRYKFELLDTRGERLPLKADPYGNQHEAPQGNASIVTHSEYHWDDTAWRTRQQGDAWRDRPVSIYEVHLGSWRRHEDGAFLSYRELADTLIPYAVDMGFTHLELLPITEHPFDGSWGYQPIGMFAPTFRYGEPDDFRYFVDRCHQAELGVIVDWVPAHFPRDEHGLARFDGTALYEHEDPRKGAHADWGTLIFNYGRREVSNYLIGSALYWINEFHIDALRVDAVASMLYLDYSREEGEWVPNEHGGNEHLEAVTFLRRLNTDVHEAGAATFAEESTAWPGVSHDTSTGGLGFTFKWNMGWMNDTLAYMSEDPLHRKHHHNRMTFSPMYAFSEHFILPLSHDEVVHGKRSLLGRMPGDEWQRFANLRAYLANMFAHPGKKLLFMGAEIAPYEEWNYSSALSWGLLNYRVHEGVHNLVRDLNALYRTSAPLYEVDYSSKGFDWIDCDNHDESVLSWIRYDLRQQYLICVTNFTPVVRQNFRLGVPELGDYRVILNTDDAVYGGSGRQFSVMSAVDQRHDKRPHFIEFELPGLATLYIERA
ncbi:MAG: 1,4-alpha-glucan branching protein GlgB [Pseudomonadota bacterium]